MKRFDCPRPCVILGSLVAPATNSLSSFVTPTLMSAAPLPDTAPIFGCPQRHTSVRADEFACRSCGINLAMAAVLAEGHTRASLPRRGELQVGQGYVTSAQLRAGLARQRESASLGVHNAIGHTLVAMRVITREQFDQAGI
jgi:hypothetical protein